MIDQIRAAASKRTEVTWGKVWAVAGPLTTLAGALIVYLWSASGQWATVNLRLDQTEAAAKAAGAAAQDVRERLSTIATEAAADRRILLRLESKMDYFRDGAGQSRASGPTPSFPPN